jgi:hypothetical protein
VMVRALEAVSAREVRGFFALSAATASRRNTYERPCETLTSAGWGRLGPSSFRCVADSYFILPMRLAPKYPSMYSISLSTTFW